MPFLALSVQAVKGQGRRKGARTGKMVEEKNCVITLPLPVRVDKPFTITKKLCETKKNKQANSNEPVQKTQIVGIFGDTFKYSKMQWPLRINIWFASILCFYFKMLIPQGQEHWLPSLYNTGAHYVGFQ